MCTKEGLVPGSIILSGIIGHNGVPGYDPPYERAFFRGVCPVSCEVKRGSESWVVVMNGRWCVCCSSRGTTRRTETLPTNRCVYT